MKKRIEITQSIANAFFKTAADYREMVIDVAEKKQQKTQNNNRKEGRYRRNITEILFKYNRVVDIQLALLQLQLLY